jgi:hypothetical protein
VYLDGGASAGTLECVNHFALVVRECAANPMTEVVGVVGRWEVGGTVLAGYSEASPPALP